MTCSAAYPTVGPTHIYKMLFVQVSSRAANMPKKGKEKAPKVFFCNVEGCKSKGFSRLHDLRRHQEEAHGTAVVPSEKTICPHCGTFMKRISNMKVHEKTCGFSKKLVKSRSSVILPNESFEAKAQHLQRGVGDSRQALTRGESVMSTHKSNLSTFEMELAAHLQDQPSTSSASTETPAARVARTKAALELAEHQVM